MRQRLKRLNDFLSKGNATFELSSSGGNVVAKPTGAADAKRDTDRVGGALAEFSGEKTRFDTGGIIEPLATPENRTLWIFFSYAALNEEEQKIQEEFFERLKEKLAYPTAEFGQLPKIEIWREGVDEVVRVVLIFSASEELFDVPFGLQRHRGSAGAGRAGATIIRRFRIAEAFRGLEDLSADLAHIVESGGCGSFPRNYDVGAHAFWQNEIS